MIAIGIDPGATGALVMIDEGRNILAVHDCPKEAEKFGLIVDDVCRQWGTKKVGVFIEHQQYMAKDGRAQGAKSAFSLGENYGIWQGLFIWRAAIKVLTVFPHVWQRCHFGSGTVVGDPKERSIRQARRLLPDLKLTPEGCRVPRHGRADAALIALYGLAVLKKREGA